MYLCCQRFLSSLQDRFSPVLYTMLLYKDKLIYSALDKHDTQVLYHYLINILFPAHLETSGMEFISKSLQTMGRYDGDLVRNIVRFNLTVSYCFLLFLTILLHLLIILIFIQCFFTQYYRLIK